MYKSKSYHISVPLLALQITLPSLFPPLPLPLLSLSSPSPPSQYKYPDGSDLERHALYRNYKELVEDKYEVSFHVPEVSHRLGSDIAMEVHIKNCGSRTVEVCGHVSCSAVMYTGKVLRSVDKKVVRQRINVSSTEVVKMEAGERVFTEFPGERVYLLFDILLAHSGTTQVFEHKVYVGPTPQRWRFRPRPTWVLGRRPKSRSSSPTPSLSRWRPCHSMWRTTTCCMVTMVTIFHCHFIKPVLSFTQMCTTHSISVHIHLP